MIRTVGAALAAAALLLADPALAQRARTKPPKPARATSPALRPAAAPEPPPVVAPPVGRAITLAEAIATTLEHDPLVASARQEVRRTRGVVQEAAGRFDTTAFANLSLERNKTFLTVSALRGEVARREFLRDSASNLTRIADDIAANLTDKSGRALPECRGSQYYINGFPICAQNIGSTDWRSFELLQNSQDKSATTGNNPDKLQQAINAAVQKRLANVVALIRRVFLPALTGQLAAIGELPRESETDTVNVDLRVLKPFRNGMTVGPIAFLQGTRFAFSDKPDSPAYGGTGVPTLYRAALGLSLDAPLLRSGGAVSADAEERSARLEADAALEQYAQTAADAALATTFSYWNLAASQELQKLLARSASGQRRIGELSRALVQGDELPRAELSRVDAAAADSEAAALQATRDLASARAELARAMGIDIARIEDAPLAADPLPTVADAGIPDAAQGDALVASLAALRGDVRAARRRVEAARVLENAARKDLQPRLDLSLQAGWNALWEDPRFAINKAWNPTGYWRAFGRTWVGPSVQVSLALELPFGNDAQRGRLVSAEAFREEAEVTARNLERVVANQARELTRTLPATAAEAAARDRAAAEADKTVGTSYERFRAGETTLLDAIVSERTRTQALADQLAARQTLALRAARLRWAAGTLLPVTRADGDIRFAPPPR